MSNTVTSFRGFYCTLEGGEGCGKTTILKKLKYLCEKKNFLILINTIARIVDEDTKEEDLLPDTLFVRESGSTLFAQALRGIAVNMNLDAWEETMTFGLARAALLRKEICPALDKNNLVISDRGIDTSLVYQGIGREFGVDKVLTCNNRVGAGFFHRLPDLTIILDLDPEIGLKRINENNRTTNKFEEESLQFLRSCRDGFKSLAKGEYPSISNERFVIIDANGDRKTVFKNTVYTLIKKIVYSLNGYLITEEDIDGIFKNIFFVEFDEFIDIDFEAADFIERGTLLNELA